LRTIFWDVETSPLIVPVWGLWENNIDHTNILEETNILCACWKELGKAEIRDLRVDPSNPRDDKGLCRVLKNVLSEADVIVAHNGDDFDLRVLNARLIYHGFDPLPPITTIDTKKVAKSKFRFVSNRLDYLGAYLGLGRKKKTSFKLWLDVLNGNQKALDLHGPVLQAGHQAPGEGLSEAPAVHDQSSELSAWIGRQK
jgi:DNA polymerase III epsilon subunit-like protein